MPYRVANRYDAVVAECVNCERWAIVEEESTFAAERVQSQLQNLGICPKCWDSPLDPHDPDFPDGNIWDCDFSSEATYRCCYAAANFSGASAYAVNLLAKYDIEYVIVTTTGITEMSFGVFVWCAHAERIDKHDMGEAALEEGRLREEGEYVPSDFYDRWPYRVRWVQIPDDRLQTCGMYREFGRGDNQV